MRAPRLPNTSYSLRRNVLRKIIAISSVIACALAAASCAKQRDEDLTPAIAAPFAVRDTLILNIPSEYSSLPGTEGNAKVPSGWPAIFHFFLPDFAADNAPNNHGAFDRDRVDVVRISAAEMKEAEPDAPGEYPPNMLRRLVKEQDRGRHEEIFGMWCYPNLPSNSGPNPEFDRVMHCFWPAENDAAAEIMIRATFPPFSEGMVNPQMQAQYFSRRYGGVEIVWRTSVKNLSRWHEIDSQVWHLIDQWNSAPAKRKEDH